MKEILERFFLHNVALKLIALACAVLLWSAVAREPLVETAYSVPIEFHEMPPNMELTTTGIPLAQVRLRGPERRIRQLTVSDVHPILNLSGTSTGEHTFDLTASQVHVPYSIHVVQVTPSEIRIGFDRSLVRQIKVRPRITGELPTGWGVQRVSTDPSTITVIGPEARVKAASMATTDPIDASGVRGAATFTTNAYVQDPLVRELKPEEIHVTVVTGPTPKEAK